MVGAGDATEGCGRVCAAPAPAPDMVIWRPGVEGAAKSRVMSHLPIGPLAEVLDDLVVVDELAVFVFHNVNGGGVDKIPRNIIGSRS